MVIALKLFLITSYATVGYKRWCAGVVFGSVVDMSIEKDFDVPLSVGKVTKAGTGYTVILIDRRGA